MGLVDLEFADESPAPTVRTHNIDTPDVSVELSYPVFGGSHGSPQPVMLSALGAEMKVLALILNESMTVRAN